MKTPSAVWNKITQQVEPVTVAEGDIEAVSVSFRSGGVTARTIDPIPTPSYEPVDDEFDPEEDDPQEYLSKLQEKSEEWAEKNEERPRNGEVFIREDVGREIKNAVYRRLQDSVKSTPTFGSVNLRRCTIEESQTTAIFELTDFVTQTNWIREDLAESLSEVDLIESPEKLAYGSIEKAYYTENRVSEGWEIDGTLYRYTEKPYEYWSAGPDTDYPTDIDEWAEFTSDTEAEEQRIKSKDKHAIHFHPMKHGMDESNPLVQWYFDVQDFASDRYEVDTELIEDFTVREVDIDQTRARIYNTLTL